MRKKGWGLLLAGLLAAATMACTKGQECDECSGDDECDTGLLCEQFTSGGRVIGSACARPSTLICTFTQ